MRREKNSEAPNRVESGLKDRIRMLVCTDNAVSKGVKVNMLSSNLRLDCVEVIVLSERERKRIAPHQHLSDFIAMVLLLARNA